MKKAMIEEKANNRQGKIFNFRPVTFCALFLAAGIGVCFLRALYGVSLWWLLALVPVALLVAFLSLPPKRWGLSVLALTMTALVGVGSFCLATATFQKKTTYDGECAVVGVVTEKYKYEDSYVVVLDKVHIDGNKEKGKMRVRLPDEKEIRFADKIAFYGTVQTDISLQDDYGIKGEEISTNLVYFAKDFDDFQVTGRAFRPLLWIRERVYDVVEKGMDETPAAFCLGLVLGDDKGIEKDLLTNVRYGGIAHLFAVSGLHIGVLFGLCAWITKSKYFLRRPRIFSFIFCTAVLLWYGGICGFSPSVIRAVVTCLSAYAFSLFGEKRDALEGVSFAAIIVLLIFPAALLEAGFALSFSAAYGIVILSRLIQRRLTKTCVWVYGVWQYKIRKKEKPSQEKDVFAGDTPPKSIPVRARDKALSLVAVSLSAWLATLPVCLTYFGYFSAWSLLLNLIFVPLVSAFYVVLFALIVAASVMPFLSTVIFFLPNAFLTLVALLFELLQFSGVSLAVSVGGLIAYQVGLLLCTDKLAIGKKAKRVGLVIAFLTAFVCTVIANFS